MDTPETAKEVLDIIDDFLTNNEDHNETRILWDVLTALRGPDAETFKDKGYTVAIRRAAFPQLAKGNNTKKICASIEVSQSHSIPLRLLTREAYMQGHFISHLRWAYTALKELGRCPSTLEDDADA